ncbi:MAG: class I SAM-dependent methyltransferase [Erysipelotrichaceae bacterium]|nr:class I SAM-dependent methyltransferase [Erysipelotrichaceae bacterium]
MDYSIKEKALADKVPIIKDGGLAFLLSYIRDNDVKSILELGTAVGYSSSQMAMISRDIHIDTLEKDQKMYDQAINNIINQGLSEQISVHFGPIEEYRTTKMYDLIFVDAAKAQYPRYLEQFLPNLKDEGAMVFDNMVFHGLIYEVEKIGNRNTRSLVRKINRFRETVQKDNRFDIIFYDNVGDGILLLRRRNT